MPVLTSPLTLHLTCLPPNIRFDKSYWRPASADTVRDKVRICNYWSIMGMFINPPPASPWLWAPLLHDRFRSVPSTYAFSSAEASNVAASVCMPPNSTNRYCADLLASASQQKKPLARRRWMISYSPTISLTNCLNVETLWRPVVALH